MTDRQFTDELATRVLGWRPTRDRYLTNGLSWISRPRFRPLIDDRDAFRVLDRLSRDYSISAIPGKGFTAEVRLRGRVAMATDRQKSRAICLAVAELLSIAAGNDLGASGRKRPAAGAK